MAGEGGGPQLLACLTGWLNHQLAHHPSMPAARVAHLLTDLRDGLVLLAVLEVLLPGLQAAREEAVHLRPHRLANLATVLATLQKERVPHLEKIVADEVRGQACSSDHQIVIWICRWKRVILDQRWLYSGRW